MSKVKLFSQDQKTKGRSITLPLVNTVSFDETDNSIEVEESLVNDLLSLDFGIKLLTADNIKEQNKKREEVKSKSSGNNTSNEVMLRALSLPEIDGLLSAYPESETKRLNTTEKKILYLVKQMK